MMVIKIELVNPFCILKTSLRANADFECRSRLNLIDDLSILDKNESKLKTSILLSALLE